MVASRRLGSVGLGLLASLQSRQRGSRRGKIRPKLDRLLELLDGLRRAAQLF